MKASNKLILLLSLCLCIAYFLLKKDNTEQENTDKTVSESKVKTSSNKRKSAKPLNIRRLNTRLVNGQNNERDEALKEFLTAKGIFSGEQPIDISEIKTLTFTELNNAELLTVSYLPNLIELNVAGTLVNNLECLVNLSELRHLNISSTNIESLEPLKDLRLKSLIMKETHAANYKAVGNIKSLEILDISNCSISEISNFKGLENLVNLDISNTRISDLSPISSLPKLKKINYTDSSVVIDSNNIELILRTR